MPMRIMLRDAWLTFPYVLFRRLHQDAFVCTSKLYSGFPSSRINLSPFTKDFRGGEQLEWVCKPIFRRPAMQRGS